MKRYQGTRQRFGTGRFGQPGPIQATRALPPRPSARFGKTAFGVLKASQSVRTKTYKILSIITVSATPPGATAPVITPQEEIDKARTLIPRLDPAIYQYSDGMGLVANTTLLWEPTINEAQYVVNADGSYYVHPGKMRALVNPDASYDLVAVWTGTGQTNYTAVAGAIGLAVQSGYWIHTPYHDIEPTPVHEFGHWIETHLKGLGYVNWPVCDETLAKPTSSPSMHCGQEYGFPSDRNPAWFTAYFSGDLPDSSGMRQEAWDYPRSFPTFQVGKPASDVSVGGWQQNIDNTNVDIWRALTDPFAKESNWAFSPSSPPTPNAYRCKLDSLSLPSASANHIVRYRVGYNVTSGDTLEVTTRLYQGTTLISQDTPKIPPNAFYRTYHWTLTPAQVASITNYADLRLDVSVVRTVDVGTTRWVRLTWARLEAPYADTSGSGASIGGTTTNVTAQAVGGGTISGIQNVILAGSVPAISVAAPSGSLTGIANVTVAGSTPGVATSIPSGALSGTRNVTIPGTTPVVSAASPPGAIVSAVETTLSGATPAVAASAPSGSMSGVRSVVLPGAIPQVSVGIPPGALLGGDTRLSFQGTPSLDRQALLTPSVEVVSGVRSTLDRIAHARSSLGRVARASPLVDRQGEVGAATLERTPAVTASGSAYLIIERIRRS